MLIRFEVGMCSVLFVMLYHNKWSSKKHEALQIRRSISKQRTSGNVQLLVGLWRRSARDCHDRKWQSDGAEMGGAMQ